MNRLITWLPVFFAAAGCCLLRPISTAAQPGFGQDMINFVNKEAHKIALRYMDSDYLARSVVAFQVNLDRSRAITNKAFLSLRGTDSLVRRLQGSYLQTKKLDSSEQEIPDDLVLDLLSANREAASRMKELAYHLEMTRGAHNLVRVLDTPYSYQDFRLTPLSNTAYYFIISSIQQSRPDFDGQIELNGEVNEDGQASGGEAKIMAAMTIYGMFELYEDLQKYERQIEKFEDAINTLPSVLPHDSVKYKRYLTSYNIVKALYSTELKGMHRHLDTMATALSDRYSLLADMKIHIDNLLLRNRVRTAYNMLGLASYIRREEEFRLIGGAQQKLRQLNDDVKDLYTAASGSDSMLLVFGSLESLRDVAQEADSFIAHLLSEPVYKPLYNGLPQLQQWFGAKEQYASERLQQGFPGSGPDTATAQLTYFSPDLNYFSRSLLDEAEPEGKDNCGLFAMLSFDQAAYYPELSISTGFGGYHTGAPFHTSFPTVGSGVWYRSSDGAYIRDWRDNGSVLVSKVRRNLDQRTVQNNVRFERSWKEATVNAPARTSEVGAQHNAVRGSNAIGSFARTVFPATGVTAPGFPGTGTTAPEPEENSSVPPLVREADREDGRHQRYLRGLTEEERSSQRVKEYEALHAKYLKYAKALELAGFTKEGTAMLQAAVGLRSEMTGYSSAPPPRPDFQPPHIPYNPLTFEDYQSVASRSAFYGTVHEALKGKSLWFGAAEEVTSGWAMTVADEFSFNRMTHYIVEANKYLFIENSANAKKLMEGELDFSFVSSAGEVIDFRGLKGKERDYALVEFEQTKIDEFTHKYRMQYPDASMAFIQFQVNRFLRYFPHDSALMKEAIDTMGPDFDFASYEDRVRLGKKMIDLLYARQH